MVPVEGLPGQVDLRLCPALSNHIRKDGVIHTFLVLEFHRGDGVEERWSRARVEEDQFNDQPSRAVELGCVFPACLRGARHEHVQDGAVAKGRSLPFPGEYDRFIDGVEDSERLRLERCEGYWVNISNAIHNVARTAQVKT